MGIISGTIRKGEDLVEGAKVYLLLNGAVAASAQTDEAGKYSCDGLDPSKEYHAVVEHSEIDGEETTLFSARSMPGIVPVPDPRLFLYKCDYYGNGPAVGVDDWNTAVGMDESYIDISDDGIDVSLAEDDWGDDSDYGTITTKDKVGLSEFNTLNIFYGGGFAPDKAAGYLVVSSSPNGSPHEKRIEFPHTNDMSVASLNISDISGSYYVQVSIENIDDNYGTAQLWIEAIWLE